MNKIYGVVIIILHITASIIALMTNTICLYALLIAAVYEIFFWVEPHKTFPRGESEVPKYKKPKYERRDKYERL